MASIGWNAHFVVWGVLLLVEMRIILSVETRLMACCRRWAPIGRIAFDILGGVRLLVECM